MERNRFTLLHLSNIVKDYGAGSTAVEALRGVDIQFRDSEFVTILGPSGCGKTTMLNILGGLDRYTRGDLIIGGKSTKYFTSRDWDAYRNRSVGFVFQNYNLIPHQSVLRNVELAMTLSGVPFSERRKRAVAVLSRVGLSNQTHKRPNQLSGGQMQRVAIARALVNNPDILLADEPTGALDSETSVQVMEILKEIAKDRLVIMVTHNQELADRYATRIVRLLDGEVIGDSNPFDAQAEKAATTAKKRKQGSKAKPSMSFLTALSLSLNNLLTKKTRTFMTAFAGSIGIIGIALILALSTGFQQYIDRIQEDTLSSYPLVIDDKTADLGSVLSSFTETTEARRESTREPDKVYSREMMGTMVNSMLSGTESNDLSSFKTYIEKNKATLDPLVNAVSYSYSFDLNLYKADTSGGIVQVNPTQVLEKVLSGDTANMTSLMSMGNMLEAFQELMDNPALLSAQYDIVAGRWPEAKDELVLIISRNNELRDLSLYSLGLRDPAELEAMMRAAAKGEPYDVPSMEFTYDELLSLTYKLVLSPAYYEKEGEGWADRRDDEAYMQSLLDDALTLSVVGIVRAAPDASISPISGSIGYLSELTQHVIETTNGFEIVKAQKEQPDIDVFTGAAFGEAAQPRLQNFDMSLIPENVRQYIAGFSEEQLLKMMEQYMPAMPQNTSTYEENLQTLGVVSEDTPSSISIYPIDFKAKESIDAFINDYNQTMISVGKDHLTISYTDFIGLLMSSVSTIIGGISYVLIAFVAISLIVSSIMIGIITYISVLERTKEIGILKSIGASRRDISRVFNAETLIVGFSAGGIGILGTLLLCIPINRAILALIGVSNLTQLPLLSSVVLVALSMALTLIAGLIPSRIAARKDPVVALRTE